MSMSSMSIESEDNGEFDAIATGERSDGGQLGARGKEQKEKSAPDVRVEGMDDDDLLAELEGLEEEELTAELSKVELAAPSAGVAMPAVPMSQPLPSAGTHAISAEEEDELAALERSMAM